jgi:acetylxylan esterase
VLWPFIYRGPNIEKRVAAFAKIDGPDANVQGLPSLVACGGELLYAEPYRRMARLYEPTWRHSMISVSPRSARLFPTAALVLLVPISAQAASLKPVSGWNGGVTLPSDVTMSIYVPDKLAANPPIVTIIHYCGGNADAVLGQAKDIRAAADQFGFILVVPAETHSGGCWDVSSKKSQTHDGGGDTHAIAQMIKYTIGQYKANADRVYATGDSSGGMMTQLLMAVYPDIFKAGSSFAGVPAGCANVFDGSGLCGDPAQTAQQWGDRARAMYPGYSGHRPRVQMFHGDADGTITYKNFGESIKEWTNVLGLSTDPTTKTDSGITLGSHQGKRQEWKSTCGYVVLDGFTSVGGDHGPSDCLFIGKYVLPFMGLDSQAAVNAALDPEIAQCGGGSDGGVTTPDASKPDTATGGNTGTGGSSGTGGSNGGASGSGTGGKTGGAGGTSSTGTSSASGGTSSTGGKSSSGGSTGGGQSSGGQSSSGGSSSSSAAGGSSSSAGSGGSSVASSSSSKGGSSGNQSSSSSGASRSGGGGCSLATASPASASTIVLALGLMLLAIRRRRR